MKIKTKLFIIVTAFMLVAGIALMLIGGSLAGWDIIGWFRSRYAWYTYFAVAIISLMWIDYLWDNWKERHI